MFQPGEKIVCVDEQFSPVDRAMFTTLPRVPRVYSVRDAGRDPATGNPSVQLVGIFGCPVDGESEPGFDARKFKLASKAEHFQSLPRPELVQVPVRVTAEVARSLAAIPLFPQVEGVFEVAEGKLETVCRLWGSTWRQSKPISEQHREIQERVDAGDSVVLMVPISWAGLDDLFRICRQLEIEHEAWLQGVLGNLARRFDKMRAKHEMAVRNEPMRGAREQRRAEEQERYERKKEERRRRGESGW